ncbi:MAG: sulfotransferase family protein [Actinomycetota bacterium]|nr:sulfotransferase family protein [Actinomycetota bacterium]MDQ5829775.1 sulfotransferase family protein [Actinomycetota bacterium]
MRVIGAGFGRTGTMSLKVALETLGFGPCYHMIEVFEHPEHVGFWEAAWRSEPVDWDKVLGVYGATVDWPACTFYEELLRRHPDAKVLLSVRDPERWYESTRNTIYELSKIIAGSWLSRVIFAFVGLFVPGVFEIGRMDNEIIWQGTFDGKFEDKRHAIEVFNRHNEEVRRRVPREHLLVYEVREGWGPLCEFLHVEEPDQPFPRLNDAAEMRRRILAVRFLSVAVPAALALLGIGALALFRRSARA